MHTARLFRLFSKTSGRKRPRPHIRRNDAFEGGRLANRPWPHAEGGFVHTFARTARSTIRPSLAELRLRRGRDNEPSVQPFAEGKARHSPRNCLWSNGLPNPCLPDVRAPIVETKKSHHEGLA